MFKKIKNEKGFTLVEILLVILVIGILMAIVVPRIGNVTNSANETALQSEINNFSKSFVSYIQETKGNNMDIVSLNKAALGSGYKFEESGTGTGDNAVYTSVVLNEWEYPYKVQIQNFNNASGMISLTTQKGDADEDKFAAYYYYKNGVVEYCTTGFSKNQVELEELATVIGTCGHKTAAF